MKKKVYFKYNGIVECDFSYKIDGERIVLRYGHDPEWTRPGKKAYTLQDTGSEFYFKDHTTKSEIALDYSQAEALLFLMAKLGENIVDHVEYEKKSKVKKNV